MISANDLWIKVLFSLSGAEFEPVDSCAFRVTLQIMMDVLLCALNQSNSLNNDYSCSPFADLAKVYNVL